MKQKRRINLFSDLWALLGIMLIIVAILIALNIYFQEPETWKNLLFDLMNSLLSALIVGLVIGTFTKVIADRLVSVQKNEMKLSAFGIQEISTGISTEKDCVELFGNSVTRKYPKEIKLLFITGNGFMKEFEHKVYKAIAEGDCIVRILLASTQSENIEYLESMEYMCPQKISYKEQIEEQTKQVIDRIRQRLKDKGLTERINNISIRFYRSEYCYNYRISKYVDAHGDVTNMCWLNVQTPTKDAGELSVVLKGATDVDTDRCSNMFFRLDEGFDKLWDKYEATEY